MQAGVDMETMYRYIQAQDSGMEDVHHARLLVSSADSPIEKSKNEGETGVFSHVIGPCLGGEQSKDGCITLPFADETASALSLCYQQVLKISYKKYGIHCLFLV